MDRDFNADLAERTRQARSDPRTAADLVSQILAAPDEDASWEAVTVLHFRGSREVFDLASALCRSPCEGERTLGANILGQLGIPDRAFPKESLQALLDLLESEKEVEVLNAAGIALGHLGDPESIPALCRLSAHPNAQVRYAATNGLGGFPEEAAVNRLLELTTDPDELVRDWAMFGLGTQIDVDSPAIREALFRGTTDPDVVVRGEALVGLANRRDERVVELVRRELAASEPADCGHHAVEVAERLGDPRLLPVLLDLKARATDGKRFDEAIRRCRDGVSNES